MSKFGWEKIIFISKIIFRWKLAGKKFDSLFRPTANSQDGNRSKEILMETYSNNLERTLIHTSATLILKHANWSEEVTLYSRNASATKKTIWNCQLSMEFIWNKIIVLFFNLIFGEIRCSCRSPQYRITQKKRDQKFLYT